MSKNYDAIIIGAGIIGTAIAYALGKKGWRVRVIDKLPICGYGSTAASSAIVQPLAAIKESVALACESHHYWQNWSVYLGDENIDERGLADYVNCGSLALKSGQSNELAITCEVVKALAIHCESLTVESLAVRLPFLSMDSFSPASRRDDPDFSTRNDYPLEGAAYFSNAGYVTDPQLATHNIMRAAEREGASFLYGERVREIRQDSGRVCGVTLENGEQFGSSVVVNAAGPHSFQVNHMAGVESDMNIKTRALRQEVAIVPRPETSRDQEQPFIASDVDTGIYLRHGRCGQLLIGSEDPLADRKEWVDPDHFEPYLSDRWRTQVERACLRIPDLEVPKQLRGVVELYDVSDDWQPIYDKSALPGFYMAIGTSGHQFKTAPVVGELMAEVITVSESGGDQDDNPVEFYLENVGYTVNSGVYSRLREVNRVSQFSVVG